MNASSATDVFSEIYKQNSWFSGSGEGSLPENTVEYRAFLQEFLRRESVRTVLDIGCGDWQSSKLIDWNGIDYIGADVVAEVISENRRLYSAPNISFVLTDACGTDVPFVDLLLLKDVLQHWPNATILEILPRLLRRCRLALITNDLSKGPQSDCPLGSHRPLNLLSPPLSFTLEEILHYDVREHTQHKTTTKAVYLYRRNA